MKTRHILLLALSLAATAAQAQMNIKISTGQTFRKDTIDHKVLTVQYGLDALTDLSKPDARMQETLRLDIGRQASALLQLHGLRGRLRPGCRHGQRRFLRADSPARQPVPEPVERTDFQKLSRRTGDDAGRTGGRHLSPALRGTRGNPPMDADARHTDPAGLPLYTRHDAVQGSAMVGLVHDGHPRERRSVEALRPAGPDSEAEDDEGHYRFMADGLEQSHGTEPILFGGKDYQPVDRKQYDKMQKRFAADPVGFITGIMPNVKITVRDNHGNNTKNPKDMPYNPIEW